MEIERPQEQLGNSKEGAHSKRSWAPSSLPPDVKASPAKTLLWQYFVTVSSRQFKCWEGSKAMGFDDPLGSLLLAMATFNGPLRSAALAFSATEYARAQPSRSPLQSTASLYQKALRMLTSTRGSFPLDAHSLLPPIAASLLLFRVEGVDQASSVRLLALARSAASCAQSLDREGRQNDSRWSILMALLKWTDICTVNSLFSQGPSVVEACVRFPFYEEETMNFSNEFRDWIIHPIYTFSRYLISPLLRIGRLVQLRKQGAGWSPEMETEAEALEELLLQSYDRDVEASKSRPAEDPDQVLRVNEAMHAATSVMYYTRVRDVPFTATFIRRSVARVQQEAAAVDCDSLSSRALVFPLFVAGCEAVDEGVRGSITRRILASKRYPELQAPKIVDHLRRIWAIRDAEPGLSWLAWSVKGLC
ncbi:hypothetical protein CPLU01_11803 [Colletotrichum plurivorum]|uniref:C6 zinc finger domain-containing protein n=1 Tax=Colletotrichum plurivorum TaxID=2175906 RepID=A0A8H6K136_9PEZI|nr:hypothetical protein CPLU01_11803 [Colletotrichum plurivorum]